jgi:hypothetical protein
MITECPMIRLYASVSAALKIKGGCYDRCNIRRIRYPCLDVNLLWEDRKREEEKEEAGFGLPPFFEEILYLYSILRIMCEKELL